MALKYFFAGGSHPLPNSIEVAPGPPLNPYLAVMLGVVAVSFAAVFTGLFLFMKRPDPHLATDVS